MRDVLVYIAGPISRGDLRENVRQACEAGIRLMKAGVAVHVPHLTCFMGQVYDGPGAIPEVLPRGTVIEDWYGMSLVEVRRCDALLRLPGESRGSDMEADEMRSLGRPVFHSVEDVLAWVSDLPETGTACHRPGAAQVPNGELHPEVTTKRSIAPPRTLRTR